MISRLAHSAKAISCWIESVLNQKQPDRSVGPTKSIMCSSVGGTLLFRQAPDRSVGPMDFADNSLPTNSLQPDT